MSLHESELLSARVAALDSRTEADEQAHVGGNCEMAFTTYAHFVGTLKRPPLVSTMALLPSPDAPLA